MNSSNTTLLTFILSFRIVILLSNASFPFFSGVLFVEGIPLTYSIKHNQKECLYERLEEKEYATFSVFIISGAELRGTATFEGPVSRPFTVSYEKKKEEDGAGKKIYDDTLRYDRGGRYASDGNILFREMLDFEHLADDDYGYGRDDDNFSVERRRKNQQNIGKIRRNGEPWQYTVQVTNAGWYRACVVASWYPISAEIEIRKSSELGIPNETENDRHVITYEQRALLDNQKYHVEDAADAEDLKRPYEQMQQLQRLMEQIRHKQTIERHELGRHAVVNQHSHARMVINSVLQTVLVLALTLFQVYSVKKWFSQDPMLG